MILQDTTPGSITPAIHEFCRQIESRSSSQSARLPVPQPATPSPS
jgi:hypothetical protein